jgi:hypothetical protein
VHDFGRLTQKFNGFYHRKSNLIFVNFCVSSDWPSACLPFFQDSIIAANTKNEFRMRISLRTLLSANSGLQLGKGEIFIADFLFCFCMRF